LIRLIFHTGYIESPTEFNFGLKDLDIAYKDSRFPENFNIKFTVEPKEFEEDNLWNDELLSRFVKTAKDNRINQPQVFRENILLNDPSGEDSEVINDEGDFLI